MPRKHINFRMPRNPVMALAVAASTRDLKYSVDIPAKPGAGGFVACFFSVARRIECVVSSCPRRHDKVRL
jgi:hypothetical protein